MGDGKKKRVDFLGCMTIINIKTGQPVILNLGKKMQIKLLAVYPFNKQDSKLLGYAHVQLDHTLKIMMNIFKNQNGALFLKFPSQKMGEAYIPHIEFINLNVERDITAVLIEDVGKKLNGSSRPAPSVHATTEFVTSGTSNEEFPF